MFSLRLAQAYLRADDRCRWRKRLFDPAHNSFTHPHSRPTSGAATSTVTIQAGILALGNRACVPAELNAAVGASATWANNDSEGTADSDAPGWNSGIIPPRGTFSVTFQTAGTFRYHCSIHPGMVGRVTVR